MNEPRRTLRHSADYRARRRAEYPDAGEGLDVLAKTIRALIDGRPIPPEVVRYVEDCEAVKARFAKPNPDVPSA